MPKKGGSKAKKKDWPDDEDTEQRLTENMKKLMSDDSSGASSVRMLSRASTDCQISVRKVTQALQIATRNLS